MKSTLLPSVILLALLLQLACSMGCSSEEQAPTPQQMEELRQQQIERSKSFQREG